MIEIIIDDSRLASLKKNSQSLREKNIYQIRYGDAVGYKESLLLFIKNNTFRFELKEKQYIFIKPYKTSSRMTVDLHAVINSDFKILLQRHLNLK